MHNTKQLDYIIHQMVLEGKSAEDVFRELRNNVEIRALAGNASNGDFQKMIKEAADSTEATIKEADRRGPLVRAHLRIMHAVTGLVGDVIEAISKVDLPDNDPRDVRDGIQLLQGLEKNPNEGVLNQAIEWISTAGIDTAELEERYDALFPAPKKEENPE